MEASEQLMEQTRVAKDSAVKLFTSMKTAAGVAEKAAREQLGERPYATLGVAAGAGFVLAGGLASILTMTVLRAGSKIAMAMLVDKLAEVPGAEAAPDVTASTTAPAATPPGAGPRS